VVYLTRFSPGLQRWCDATLTSDDLEPIRSWMSESALLSCKRLGTDSAGIERFGGGDGMSHEPSVQDRC
jgi:hypothetical protein